MIAALAVAFFAECAPAEASAAQQACCEAMHHDCGPEGEPQACCSTTGSQIGDFTIARQVSLQPPVTPASVPIPAALPPVPETLRHALRYLAPVKPPGVATYVLIAAFRI